MTGLLMNSHSADGFADEVGVRFDGCALSEFALWLFLLAKYSVTLFDLVGVPLQISVSSVRICRVPTLSSILNDSDGELGVSHWVTLRAICVLLSMWTILRFLIDRYRSSLT